jgi:hypothetical protein
MIALLANPPAPLALRADLLAFRRPNTTPSFSELIWKLHQTIVNPTSHAEEVKVAKRDMLGVIGKAKQSPNMPGQDRRLCQLAPAGRPTKHRVERKITK